MCVCYPPWVFVGAYMCVHVCDVYCASIYIFMCICILLIVYVCVCMRAYIWCVILYLSTYVLCVYICMYVYDRMCPRMYHQCSSTRTKIWEHFIRLLYRPLEQLEQTSEMRHSRSRAPYALRTPSFKKPIWWIRFSSC